jgi:hypothetical protein
MEAAVAPSRRWAQMVAMQTGESIDQRKTEITNGIIIP